MLKAIVHNQSQQSIVHKQQKEIRFVLQHNPAVWEMVDISDRFAKFQVEGFL